MNPAHPVTNILWHKSKAFSITGNSLYINDSRFQNGVINSEEQYLNLRDEIIKKLSKLRLPDGRNPFPDIVIKPKNLGFSSDGPDISINSNIVSCERPSYNVQSDSDGSYFVATKKGDSGSHRRNSVFIGNGRFFTKLHANKIFEHADLPALILYLASVEPDDMPEDLLTFLQRSKGVIT